MSTTELTRQDIAENAAYWARTDNYIDEWLRESDRTKFDTAQMYEEQEKTSNLQAVADRYASFAIEAYVIGSYNKARRFAEYVALAAEEALKQESFVLVYWGRKGLPERLLQAEKARGRMETLQLLFYARWLLSGKRDEVLWNQSADAAQEMFEASRGKEIPIDDVIRTFLEAERFAQAVEVFRKTWRKKKELDMEELIHDAQLNSFALVAEWKSGNANVEEAARKALEFWYVQSQKWYWDHADLSWRFRLAWASLHGKYISGVTEIEPLFSELRGC